MPPALPETMERGYPKLIHLALRWMLVLATALVLLPPTTDVRPPLSITILLALFALSNVALGFMPVQRLLRRSMDYGLVITDTFLVAVVFFRVGVGGTALQIVFFLTLLVAALGADLVRTIIAATLVSSLYIYMMAGALPPEGWVGLLLRVPFLYMVALYYGNFVERAKREQERVHGIEIEKQKLESILEITAATTSTLDLRDVLYTIVRHIAQLIRARRCSILEVEQDGAHCTVLASSDDPNLQRLTLDLAKYPEVRTAIQTRSLVVIEDVTKVPMMDECRQRLAELNFQSIIVVPILFRETLLGMLFIRAARARHEFTQEEIKTCQVIANASANALNNAMTYRALEAEALNRQKTADQLQNILDYSPDLIFTTDMTGTITQFSRGGKDLLGHAAVDVLGTSGLELFSDPAGRTRIEVLLREGRPVEDLETTMTRRDGSAREVLVAASPLCDKNGATYGTVAIVRDVSELREARRHLLQAEKMSAVGLAVSGVAHELNNPLTGVLGFAQLLMADTRDPAVKRPLTRILDSALRCQKIVHNLLAFTRQGPSKLEMSDLNEIVQGFLEPHADHLRRDRIQIESSLDPAIPRTLLDPAQIQQVLLNLVNNAHYEMAREGRGGVLRVTTRLQGKTIVLEVEDDGPGIPREAIGKAFDPFFTTKPVGQGTGLGLTVSYGIVRDHEGRIRLQNRTGRGARVTVELPVKGETQATCVVAPEAGDPPKSGRALKILAVDDESVILELLMEAFGHDIHRLETASSGKEALGKLEVGSFDVVLLDLRMPGMDGRQLFEEIRRRWPDVSQRVLFATGDTACMETRSFLESSGRPFIHKPYRLEALEKAFTAVGNVTVH